MKNSYEEEQRSVNEKIVILKEEVKRSRKRVKAEVVQVIVNKESLTMLSRTMEERKIIIEKKKRKEKKNIIVIELFIRSKEKEKNKKNINLRQYLQIAGRVKKIRSLQKGD